MRLGWRIGNQNEARHPRLKDEAIGIVELKHDPFAEPIHSVAAMTSTAARMRLSFMTCPPAWKQDQET